MASMMRLSVTTKEQLSNAWQALQDLKSTPGESASGKSWIGRPVDADKSFVTPHCLLIRGRSREPWGRDYWPLATIGFRVQGRPR